MKIELMNETEVKWVDRVGDFAAPILLAGSATALLVAVGAPVVLVLAVVTFTAFMAALVPCLRQ